MTKHNYIKKICLVVSEKSSCEKSKVGAVFITEEYEILSTGFNEAPRGFPHCVGKEICIKHTHGKCKKTAHAEMNAITQAAKNGVALKDSILFCSRRPCADCLKLLINIGIQAIFCDKPSEFITEYDGKIDMFRW